jgi:hypothetical protein
MPRIGLDFRLPRHMPGFAAEITTYKELADWEKYWQTN